MLHTCMTMVKMAPLLSPPNSEEVAAQAQHCKRFKQKCGHFRPVSDRNLSRLSAMDVGALPGRCLWEDVVLKKSKPSICRSTDPLRGERASIRSVNVYKKR